MNYKRLITVGLVCFLSLSSGFLASCKDTDSPSGTPGIVQVTADTSVVTKLGITTRPLTDSLARIIAESASTGKTVSSMQVTQDGIVFYDVQVQVGTLVIDVRVRVTDGAVITILGDPEDNKHG